VPKQSKTLTQLRVQQWLQHKEQEKKKNLNFVRQRIGFHARGRVDRIAEEAVPRHLHCVADSEDSWTGRDIVTVTALHCTAPAK
jgi:hypothetical protein